MNGYFELVNAETSISLNIYPPTDGGEPVKVSEIMDYLGTCDILYDTVALGVATGKAEQDAQTILLENRKAFPQREKYKFDLSDDKMTVTLRFYAPSVGGDKMSKTELLNDLQVKGIRYGIDEAAIDGFLATREYCKDVVVAAGKPPRHGTDAWIEYFFNTDKKAKPTLNKDGSVDFFQLNVVNHCQAGDVLARLHKEDPGEPGMCVTGERIKQREVRRCYLKQGRNMEVSEDGLVLTSTVDGHVELVEGQVFVSDVLQVENVDTSTGNIEYDGSVQINGNVCTNFEVHAKGNVEIKGVVEGALVEAGGNVIIARGVNGMGKGVIKAGGNIVAKFFENATAEAKGYISSESILHSKISAGTEVNVDGKRGFITGGCVSAPSLISVKTLGSEMSADTVIEVGADPAARRRYSDLQKQVEEDQKTVTNIQQILVNTKAKVAQGAKLNPDQAKYVQSLALAYQQKSEAIKAATAELEELKELVGGSEGACVIVNNIVYPGVKICINDVSIVVQKPAQYCRFIKSRGDVKLTGI